jgi:ribosomal protein S18 acetylase RimI-like enzyme
MAEPVRGGSEQTDWPRVIGLNLRQAARTRAGRVIEFDGYDILLPAGPWPMYAVPEPGWAPDTADIRTAMEVLRAYDLPPAMEWVHEDNPRLAALIEADPLADLVVGRHPLLLADDASKLQRRPLTDTSAVIDLVSPTDADRDAVLRVPAVAFSAAEAEVGPTPVDVLDHHHDRLVAGTTITAALRLPGVGPVSVGSLQIERTGAEIVGLGTLPWWQGNGFGSAVCHFLAETAFDRGVEFTYLSASDERVARLYEQVGFRRVGTFCSASGRPEPTTDLVLP